MGRYGRIGRTRGEPLRMQSRSLWLQIMIAPCPLTIAVLDRKKVRMCGDGKGIKTKESIVYDNLCTS
jgi:hypothetical protein